MSSRNTKLWAPVVLWALAVFVASSFPGSAYPRVRGFADADKLVHIVIFGGLSFWVYRALRGTPRLAGKGGLLLMAVAAVATILYGVSDEIHQAFVPKRSSDVMDVVADAVGAVLGCVAAHWVLGRHRRAGRTQTTDAAAP